MKGAVAAGHQLTAEAGARILAEGGNAVDACIAGAFMSWVAESPLTGPGAGGFMLVHRARDRSMRLLDFFVATPGLGASTRRRGEMESVDVDFSGESTQAFRIGSASCAVPGTTAGLAAVHRRFGTLPWRTLFEPAIEAARTGIELTRPQAYLHAILDLILRHTDEGRRVYGIRGSRVAAGDVLRLPDLAGTMERLADSPGDLYTGDLARAIVGHLQDTGGAVTAEDLRRYRVIWRRPVRAGFKGCVFESNPPPSSGGILIGYGLTLLDRLPAGLAGLAGGDRGARGGYARAGEGARRPLHDATASRRARAATCSRTRASTRRSGGSSPARRGRPSRRRSAGPRTSRWSTWTATPPRSRPPRARALG